MAEEPLSYHHIQQLQEKLAISIHRPALYEIACTHRSFQNEQKQAGLNNERLEFLGDTVLSLIVAGFLYERFPDFTEGELSFAKSKLVDASSCAYYTKQLEVESFLLLGKGEEKNLGKGRESILADFFESLIGAMYLDLGIEATKQFLIDRFEKKWIEDGGKKEENEKVLLQEYAQKKFQVIPDYQIVKEEGPDHDKNFVVAVFICDKQVGEGIGTSKKQAQQSAAKAALEALKQGELL